MDTCEHRCVFCNLVIVNKLRERSEEEERQPLCETFEWVMCKDFAEEIKDDDK